MAGLPGESLHIAYGAGIGRDHFQHLPRLHGVDGLFGLEDRHWARKAAAIQDLIGNNQVSCHGDYLLV
jgi:hypothetical protein